ncbi:MAG: trypsin-like peptidase domain-containing protein [Lentisphaeria bacterium]|nr:trypsin-like peptidase domain-containing protein [Lentisphaeria bacterium]
MSEYNWRQEREKFRPDFQKQVPVTEEVKSEPVKRVLPAKWYMAAGAVLLTAIIIIGLFAVTGKDSSAQLAEDAEKHKTAVGLVALTVEFQNGRKLTVPVGTAWAFNENSFATNGHVANALRESLQQLADNSAVELLEAVAQKHGCKSVKEFLEKLGPQANTVLENAKKEFLAMIKSVRADVIINGTQRKSYSVTHVQIHKDYGTVGTKFDPDVAVLTVDGRHDNYFKLADKNTLYGLKSGLPIAFLGFPMENLNNDNVNVDNPVASMQSGIVVAVSDFEMKDAGKNGNFLLRHNLPATGGASGSPIFNQKGEVVALLYAINLIGQVKTVNNNVVVTRAPSGVQINFGVRADLLEGMGKAVSFKEFMSL